MRNPWDFWGGCDIEYHGLEMGPFFSKLLYFPTGLNIEKLVIIPAQGWSFAEKEQRVNN